MNIAVISFLSGNYYFRPDTTLEKESADYYCPENVKTLTAIPCLYTKIVKPGKAIVRKYADRYCNEFGFGILLNDSNENLPLSVRTSMDHSTVLSEKRIGESVSNANGFKLLCNEKICFSSQFTSAEVNRFYDVICMITEKVSLRIGDIVIIELSEGFSVENGDIISGLTIDGIDRLFYFNIY